jgi:hypothetical protein
VEEIFLGVEGWFVRTPHAAPDRAGETARDFVIDETPDGPRVRLEPLTEAVLDPAAPIPSV